MTVAADFTDRDWTDLSRRVADLAAGLDRADVGGGDPVLEYAARSAATALLDRGRVADPELAEYTDELRDYLDLPAVRDRDAASRVTDVAPVRRDVAADRRIDPRVVVDVTADPVRMLTRDELDAAASAAARHRATLDQQARLARTGKAAAITGRSVAAIRDEHQRLAAPAAAVAELPAPEHAKSNSTPSSPTPSAPWTPRPATSPPQAGSPTRRKRTPVDGSPRTPPSGTDSSPPVSRPRNSFGAPPPHRRALSGMPSSPRRSARHRRSMTASRRPLAETPRPYGGRTARSSSSVPNAASSPIAPAGSVPKCSAAPTSTSPPPRPSSGSGRLRRRNGAQRCGTGTGTGTATSPTSRRRPSSSNVSSNGRRCSTRSESEVATNSNYERRCAHTGVRTAIRIAVTPLCADAKPGYWGAIGRPLSASRVRTPAWQALAATVSSGTRRSTVA